MAEHEGSTDEQDAGEASASSQQEKKRPLSPQRRVFLILSASIVLIAVLLTAVLLWLHARHFESSDDAFIDTDIVHVAPKASGQVEKVFVSDNQAVHAGQLLVQLDDTAARAQLVQALAARAQAMAQIAQAHGQITVAQAQLSQAKAGVVGPSAQAARAQRDYSRYLAVQASTPGAVAVQQIDQARTAAVDQGAQLVSSQKQVDTAAAQLSSTQTQLQAGSAQLQAADAQIAQAQLQIDYARVTALQDGHVSHKTVAVGAYAQAGQDLMSIVPYNLWVTANFKETQLARIRPGQAVDLKVDAYPGVVFHARVQSIQRGAGQAFSVLPSQNASGNYVKVVQRVPVKIVLEGPMDPVRPLGPGMSVEPRVRVS